MEEFDRTDLSIDLSLMLRPPSPPPPHLGLGLGLASAASAESDFISRPPDLISPRFEPRTSQPGFGDPEPGFVPEESPHLAPGRNSSFRWRRYRPTMAPAASKKEEISKAEEASQSANFDCNICLAMASEPVVTSCGHLFCWPCLYQWLHVHSASNECPVCKGEVTDLNITPIYGRGVKPPAGREEDGSSVPPRPHGRRVEGLRHRRRTARPFSRRVEEIIRLRNGQGRAEGFDGTESREGERRFEDLIGVVSDQIMHRATRFARRLQREDPERIIGRRSRVRSAAGAGAGAQVIMDEIDGRMPGGGLAGREALEALRDLHFTRRIRADRLVAIRTRLESMEGMLQTLTSANPDPIASVPLHLSAAASVFVIPDQGAAGQPGFVENVPVPAPGAVQQEIRGGEAVLDQGSVRTIHLHRRMDVQSSGAAASGSSVDVDGGLVPARKIRRLH